MRLVDYGGTMGMGVHATRAIKARHPIMMYCGFQMGASEAKEREELYQKHEMSCNMLEVKIYILHHLMQSY